jgi:hypothetical protein
MATSFSGGGSQSTRTTTDHRHGYHVTLKILIVRFSRNFFSRTAEGIELKSGIYVSMNVFNMCCYCLRHLKIQNGHHRRSRFALKPYGKQHFHLLLENSQTEFNQTWQRCFLWGPKKLSWVVLTRPTYWVLSLLCIGQFVMPIIPTWVLFCSKMCRTSVRPGKTKSDNINLFYATI